MLIYVNYARVVERPTGSQTIGYCHKKDDDKVGRDEQIVCRREGDTMEW